MVKKFRIPKKNKYNAKIVEIDDIKFRSQKEANRYLQLKALKEKGDVLWFLDQVSIRLPGKIKYRLDFMVWWADGTTTYEDIKGFKTDVYKLKKKLIETLYPIKITEL